MSALLGSRVIQLFSVKKVIKDLKTVWTDLPVMSANSYLTQNVSLLFLTEKASVCWSFVLYLWKNNSSFFSAVQDDNNACLIIPAKDELWKSQQYLKKYCWSGENLQLLTGLCRHALSPWRAAEGMRLKLCFYRLRFIIFQWYYREKFKITTS